MADLIAFLQARPRIHDYFPSFEELPKMGREWVANVLQALCGSEFEQFVRTKEAAHREKVARQKNYNVRRLD